jgi:enoyl-CoA hydratase
MSDASVDVKIVDRVAIVTMNRPHKRNALTVQFPQAISSTIEELDNDNGVDVLVLTGADPAFCAGLDLTEVAADGGAVNRAGADVSTPWPRLKKPLIGAVNGAAITAGFELALNCDFLIASARARFADTHVAVGVMPGGGLSVLLPRRIGMARAMEISLTGAFIDADEALRLGLVNHVVPHDDLLRSARDIANNISGKNQRAVTTLLASMRRIAAVDGEEAGLGVERITARKWLEHFDHSSTAVHPA